MKKTSKTIVFFGSGPVAAKSLSLLLTSFEVEAVITKPATEAEMKAIAGSISVHSAANKKELDTLLERNTFSSQLGILIDFGVIVSQKVIDKFEFGIINSHFSLLPELRGADPITFSILSGQEKTGVSLMLVVEAMDEGPIIACGVYELTGAETTPQLTSGLIGLSDALLKKEIPKFLSGESKGVAQSEIANLIPDYPSVPTYSRKLTKDDGTLNFNKPAVILEREVRAFIDWPRSRTEIAGKDVVILKASVDESQSGEIGKVFRASNKKIGIYTQKGTLTIEELKPAGKNKMTAQAFLAGYGSKL